MLASAPLKPGVLVGRAEPRLYTAPLRELTPETSLGFEAIDFIESVLKVELFPWQRWWLIHALELLEDGGFRFRTIITLVARQNGKTTLVKALTLWMMFSGRAMLVLGTAQNLEIAKETWYGVAQMVQDDPVLDAERRHTKLGVGDQELKLTNGARYRISAATGNAGRGMSVDLLLLDEIRQHKKWDAWGALSKTTMARPNSLALAISNAGDDESVVLNTMRDNALAGSDETVGLFEWSAPDGCELDDEDAWAQANPALGHGTLDVRAIRSAKATDPPQVFRTEVLCQHVASLDDAVVTAPLWESCLDRGVKVNAKAGPLALCFDVALDGGHATLAAAQLGADGKVRVTTVASWPSARAAVPDLATWKERLKPAAFGWFSGGPADQVKADLEKLKLEPIKGDDIKAVCQEFAAMIPARGLLHNGDPLLSAHVLGAKKYRQGDGWRFVRRGTGHVDAAYAAAGAVRLARTLPPRKRVMLVTPSK